MPGNVIGKAMNLGFAGNISRSSDAIISNRLVKSSDSASVNFGDPVVLNSDNTFSKFGAAGTAAAFAGIAVREIKQAADYYNQIPAYAPGQPCDVAERGNITVVCNVGTPTAGGDVYVRVTANGAIPAGVVGGFEAAADSTNTIKLTNVKWKTGKIDANKVAEVTIIVRNNP